MRYETIDINEVEVFNFKGAIRGMRNPLESWNYSDSYFNTIDDYDDDVWDVIYEWTADESKTRESQGLEAIEEQSDKWVALEDKYDEWLCDNAYINNPEGRYFEVAFLGPKDMKLAQRLITAGPEHAKFMRQIFVSMDITAPLYWWKEFDTYKVGTTANSTSTMHKLASKPITKDMFQFDEFDSLYLSGYQDMIVALCEDLRQMYKNTADKNYWRALIQLLPNAWKQTRTVTLSYANLRNMYFQRQNHKLKEWNEFCNFIETLPYGKELICIK